MVQENGPRRRRIKQAEPAFKALWLRAEIEPYPADRNRCGVGDLLARIVAPCHLLELPRVEELPQGLVVAVRPKVEVVAPVPGIHPVEHECGWVAVAPYHGAKVAVAE